MRLSKPSAVSALALLLGSNGFAGVDVIPSGCQMLVSTTPMPGAVTYRLRRVVMVEYCFVECPSYWPATRELVAESAGPSFVLDSSPGFLGCFSIEGIGAADQSVGLVQSWPPVNQPPTGVPAGAPIAVVRGAMVGEGISITLPSFGVPHSAVRWYRNGTEIPGATGDRLDWTVALADAGACFEAGVSNACGMAVGLSVTLDVSPPPSAAFGAWSGLSWWRSASASNCGIELGPCGYLACAQSTSRSEGGYPGMQGTSLDLGGFSLLTSTRFSLGGVSAESSAASRLRFSVDRPVRLALQGTGLRSTSHYGLAYCGNIVATIAGPVSLQLPGDAGDWSVPDLMLVPGDYEIAVSVQQSRPCAQSTVSICSDGTSLSLRGAFIGATCRRADLNADGTVAGDDLGVLLYRWGPGDPASDIDGSGSTDGGDLAILLAEWGPCDGP